MRKSKYITVAKENWKKRGVDKMKVKVTTDGTKRNKKFEKLCRLSQPELKNKLKMDLTNLGKDIKIGDGYLYAKGTLPIILTAHLDTVHKSLPKEIVYKKGTISSPQGIGGDDRCGVYMIMEIIKEFPCHVLFFEDEEIGGVGSSKFTETELCKSLKGKINYAIDLDRANYNDAVYYDCDNPEFEKFIESEFWKMAYGSFTDICHICPELGCAGVNLSCGYYKQHTTSEYVVLVEMEIAIEETKKLIARTTEKDAFEFIERKIWTRGWNSLYKGNSYLYDDFDDYYEEQRYDNYFTDGEYLIVYNTNNGIESESVLAYTEAEAIGLFLMDHSTMSYNDIEEITML